MIETSTTPGLAALPVGEKAPDFTLRDQNNEAITLSKFRGDKAVLLVFYPYAFTGICTGELGQIEANLDTFVRTPTRSSRYVMSSLSRCYRIFGRTGQSLNLSVSSTATPGWPTVAPS
jgi:cytochrome oxidase Cu insertion factor (SCO1/SenC/PrrC family)